MTLRGIQFNMLLIFFCLIIFFSKFVRFTVDKNTINSNTLCTRKSLIRIMYENKIVEVHLVNIEKEYNNYSYLN